MKPSDLPPILFREFLDRGIVFQDFPPSPESAEAAGTIVPSAARIARLEWPHRIRVVRERDVDGRLKVTVATFGKIPG